MEVKEKLSRRFGGILFVLRLFWQIARGSRYGDIIAIGKNLYGVASNEKSRAFYCQQRHYFYVAHCRVDKKRLLLAKLLTEGVLRRIYCRLLWYLVIAKLGGRYILCYRNWLLQRYLRNIVEVKVRRKYIITLVDKATSLAGAQRCLASAKRYGEDSGLEIFPGVKKADSQEFFLRNNLTYSEFVFPGRDRDTQAEMGCFASHYLLWKKCLEQREPIVILEDDVEFRASLPSLRFKEVINLGNPCLELQAKVMTAMPGMRREVCYPFENLVGAHAYAITPEAANKLVVSACDMVAMPADNFINARIIDIVSCNPSPLVISPNFSSISLQKKYRDG